MTTCFNCNVDKSVCGCYPHSVRSKGYSQSVRLNMPEISFFRKEKPICVHCNHAMYIAQSCTEPCKKFIYGLVDEEGSLHICERGAKCHYLHPQLVEGNKFYRQKTEKDTPVKVCEITVIEHTNPSPRDDSTEQVLVEKELSIECEEKDLPIEVSNTTVNEIVDDENENSFYESCEFASQDEVLELGYEECLKCTGNLYKHESCITMCTDPICMEAFQMCHKRHWQHLIFGQKMWVKFPTFNQDPDDCSCTLPCVVVECKGTGKLTVDIMEEYETRKYDLSEVFENYDWTMGNKEHPRRCTIPTEFVKKLFN